MLSGESRNDDRTGQILQYHQGLRIHRAGSGGGKDVFVHVTAVQAAGLRGLNEGQRVSFDIEADKRGPKAVNLKLL